MVTWRDSNGKLGEQASGDCTAEKCKQCKYREECLQQRQIYKLPHVRRFMQALQEHADAGMAMVCYGDAWDVKPCNGAVTLVTLHFYRRNFIWEGMTQGQMDLATVIAINMITLLALKASDAYATMKAMVSSVAQVAELFACTAGKAVSEDTRAAGLGLFGSTSKTMTLLDDVFENVPGEHRVRPKIIEEGGE